MLHLRRTDKHLRWRIEVDDSVTVQEVNSEYDYEIGFHILLTTMSALIHICTTIYAISSPSRKMSLNTWPFHIGSIVACGLVFRLATDSEGVYGRVGVTEFQFLAGAIQALTAVVLAQYILLQTKVLLYFKKRRKLRLYAAQEIAGANLFFALLGGGLFHMSFQNSSISHASGLAVTCTSAIVTHILLAYLVVARHKALSISVKNTGKNQMDRVIRRNRTFSTFVVALCGVQVILASLLAKISVTGHKVVKIEHEITLKFVLMIMENFALWALGVLIWWIEAPIRNFQLHKKGSPPTRVTIPKTSQSGGEGKAMTPGTKSAVVTSGGKVVSPGATGKSSDNATTMPKTTGDTVPQRKEASSNETESLATGTGLQIPDSGVQHDQASKRQTDENPLRKHSLSEPDLGGNGTDDFEAGKDDAFLMVLQEDMKRFTQTERDACEGGSTRIEAFNVGSAEP